MEWITGMLTRAARPRLQLGKRVFPAWGFHVVVGALLGAGLATWLAAAGGLAGGGAAVVAAGSLGAGVLLALVQRLWQGTERYAVYAYQLAVLSAGTGLAWLLRQPVLPVLDGLAAGFALTQAIGRLGCFRAGCCHGRPQAWGVRYTPAHASLGFPTCLVGVPLLPLQLLEACGMLMLSVWSVQRVLAGSPAGEALAGYLVSYAVMRFGLEFLRGDLRPLHLGLSTAQWTASGSALGVAVLQAFGVLPQSHLRLAIVAGLVLVFGGFLLAAHRAKLSHLSGVLPGLPPPQQVCELAEALAWLDKNTPPMWAKITFTTTRARVIVTPSGLCLSTSQVETGFGPTRTYTLSNLSHPLFPAQARTLARLILALQYPLSRSLPAARILPGPEGIFHLLI